MKSTDPRHGWPYQRARKTWIAARQPGETCVLCGGVVDLGASGRTPLGPTVEHRVPIRERPDLALDTAYWALAHNRCQARQGARATNARNQPLPPLPPFPTTRKW